MNEKLKSVGTVALGLIFFLGLLIVIGLLIGGVAWVSSRLLPWLSIASVFAFALLILVLLPLSAIRATRSFAAVTILYISYLFGATVWIEGLLTTLSLWGGWAVIVGLFFAGVGVVPVGMLAALFHKQWWQFLELVGLIILTFGCRIYALWISQIVDEAAVH